MTWTLKTLLALLMGVWMLPKLALAVPGGALKRDYSVIFERNPFGLRPPPPPKTNSVPLPKPDDEILLTGITSIGKERAYFMSVPPKGQTPQFFDLREGESRNHLEVVAIDPDSKSVRVRRKGVENVMTFQTDGVKPPALAAKPATRQGSARSLPGSAPRSNTRSLINTPSRTPTVRSIPTRNLRVTPRASANLTRQAKVEPFSPEQEVLMMELQRAANPHITFPPTPIPESF